MTKEGDQNEDCRALGLLTGWKWTVNEEGTYCAPKGIRVYPNLTGFLKSEGHLLSFFKEAFDQDPMQEENTEKTAKGTSKESSAVLQILEEATGWAWKQLMPSVFVPQDSSYGIKIRQLEDGSWRWHIRLFGENGPAVNSKKFREEKTAAKDLVEFIFADCTIPNVSNTLRFLKERCPDPPLRKLEQESGLSWEKINEEPLTFRSERPSSKVPSFVQIAENPPYLWVCTWSEGPNKISGVGPTPANAYRDMTRFVEEGLRFLTGDRE